MKKSTIGFLLIIALGVGGMLIWRAVTPLLFEKQQIETSDSSDLDTLRIGGDNYLGYWFITSPDMRKQSKNKGFRVSFTDDGGAYADRLQKFADSEYDCIVLPINSYLAHGGEHKYPGVIVAAVSESRGADGIVGFGDRLPSGKINDLNDASLNYVYTPDSPSSFLLDLTISDFDLDQLRNGGGNRIMADGSGDVLNKARTGEGDVFIMWEPDLSKALALPGMKYLWGSDRFSGYIVDVFVFHRDVVSDKPELVRNFLTTYFRTMSSYANDRERMVEEMARSTSSSKKVVTGQLSKIEWFDLGENCRQQFGIPAKPGDNARDGVINTIIACTDVMVRSGALEKDPLEGDPYRITNSKILEDLSRGNMMVAGKGGGEVHFEELNASGWSDLSEIGTFRIEPITFQSWDNQLTDEGKSQIDKIASLLTNNYPSYRIKVRGHTGVGGDEKENQVLSQARAESVVQYLKAVHSINSARILAEGMGSSKPAPRKAGESMRAWRYRLPRVEFVAVEANRL